ncbi:MAG: hypothetical protein Q8P97_01600 [bacterium]|nr:hypothetical protein [bacterium]
MFTCYVFAPCEQQIRDELSPDLNKLTPAQLQERMTQSLVFLKSRLPSLPTIVEITEHPEQGAVTIFSTQDISADLIERGLYVINFGEPRKFYAGQQRFFYIRATLSASPSNASEIASNLNKAQGRIEQIILEEFGGEAGPYPYPYTYLIPIDPDDGLPQDTNHRNRADLAQLWKIESVLLQNGLSAELGVKFNLQLIARKS